MLAGVQLLYRYIIHLELHKQQTTMFIVISNLKSRTFLYCITTNVFTCSSKDIILVYKFQDSEQNFRQM